MKAFVLQNPNTGDYLLEVGHDTRRIELAFIIEGFDAAATVAQMKGYRLWEVDVQVNTLQEHVIRKVT